MAIFSFGKELLHRFSRDEIFGLSAELAYFFLLSLFPFLIFLLSLIAYLPISQDDVLGAVRQYAPGNTMNLIETNVQQIMSVQRGGLLSFGLLAALWSASNGINAVVRAFNRAYEVNENRSFIVTRGTAVLLTFAMVFVIIVALLLPVFGKEIGMLVATTFGYSNEFLAIWNAIRFSLSFIILLLVFMALYFIAPNKRLHIKEVYLGALFATVGWMTVSYLFSYYVSNFGNYTATYGSLGGIIVLLIWFYLSGLLIIVGGEINAILQKKKEVNV